MIAKKTESKFQRFAEVLPQNARTAVILKEREEIRLAKEAQEKQVSERQFFAKRMAVSVERFLPPSLGKRYIFSRP